MGRPLVTACVFCLVCCSHVSCASHDDNHLEISKSLLWKDSPKSEFIDKVFQTYGNGETISPQGFEKLLKELKLDNIIPNSQNLPNGNATSNTTSPAPQDTEDHECISMETLFNGEPEMTIPKYKEVCPVLLSQLMPITFEHPPCDHHHGHTITTTTPPKHRTPEDIKKIWMYSTFCIVLISLCGLLGVAVIPVMQKVFYHKLLQFLVALAVGTLCGDALLHLLPHAMMSNHSHSHGEGAGHSHGSGTGTDDHDTNIWRGFTAMLGVVFFFFIEKFLNMIAEWRSNRQRRTQFMPKVRVMLDADVPTSGTKVGEKLCKHKYSSYPYCYGEIANNPDNHQKGDEANDANPVCKNMTSNSSRDADGFLFDKNTTNTQSNGPAQNEKALLEATDENADERYTVIIREHENTHHGHSHSHGHVHSAPQSMSSVAWMVVMGDGLHNFTDGMAIGAAFSANIAGGFSTALAVFCHELPHELGDFAVLLKAGMSAKQAVFYNLLSSILCFFGMCAGIVLGHDETMSQWVFAAAAGMFLYIALVDMIPELTSSHSKEGSLCQCVLHFAGLMIGIFIMLLIAVYEEDLKTVFGK